MSGASTSTRFATCASGPRQRGVALAIVVWFIAGMSLLVAGIVSHARVDTQLAQLHLSRAKAVAVGDGAVRLLLADRLLSDNPPVAEGLYERGEYRLGNTDVSVTLYPTTSFVNLNTAPRSVLVALFTIVGQMPEGDANLLADNVLKWRGDAPGEDKRRALASRFRSIEDLVRVDGVSRTLLDAIRDFIATDSNGAGGTDWAVAPAVLMQVLEAANPAEVEAAARRRETLMGARATAASRGDQRRLKTGSYRADALVTLGDSVWLRRLWVSTSSSSGSSLPWRVVRTEAPRVVEPRHGNG